MAFDFFANPAGKKRKPKSKSKSKKSKSGARKAVAKRAVKKRAAKRAVKKVAIVKIAVVKRARRSRRASKRKIVRGVASLTGCKIKIRKARKGESLAHVAKAGRRAKRRVVKKAMRSNPYNPFAAFLNPAPKKGAAKRGRKSKHGSKPKHSRSKSARHVGVSVARVVKIEKDLSGVKTHVRKLASHVTKLDQRTQNMNRIREAVGIPRLPSDAGTVRGH